MPLLFFCRNNRCNAPAKGSVITGAWVLMEPAHYLWNQLLISPKVLGKHLVHVKNRTHTHTHSHLHTQTRRCTQTVSHTHTHIQL
uniref:Uncharacterized protein n=1 Tax=Anguilla anguilla TaxID=7936 RepID=A0A0E9TQ45_ANGAN